MLCVVLSSKLFHQKLTLLLLSSSIQNDFIDKFDFSSLHLLSVNLKNIEVPVAGSCTRESSLAFVSETIFQSGFPSFLALPVFTLCCTFPASTHIHSYTCPRCLHWARESRVVLRMPIWQHVASLHIDNRAARTFALNPSWGFSSGGRGGAV